MNISRKIITTSIEELSGSGNVAHNTLVDAAFKAGKICIGGGTEAAGTYTFVVASLKPGDPAYKQKTYPGGGTIVISTGALATDIAAAVGAKAYSLACEIFTDGNKQIALIGFI